MASNDCTELSSSDEYFINLLDRNDLTLKEYVELNEEHFKNLEEQIQQIELIRENILSHVRDMETEVRKSLSTNAILIENLKLAIEREPA